MNAIKRVLIVYPLNSKETYFEMFPTLNAVVSEFGEYGGDSVSEQDGTLTAVYDCGNEKLAKAAAARIRRLLPDAEIRIGDPDGEFGGTDWLPFE